MEAMVDGAYQLVPFFVAEEIMDDDMR